MRALASIVVLGAFGLAGCGSSPKNTVDTDAPAWVRQPTRTVDAGYIVYVGTSEDPLLDQARFKAEAVAIEDLVNECSFAPKGARVEDHYEHVGSSGGMPVHQAYVKVGVDFQSCEEAKSANDPEAIRKIANVAMAEEVKRYQTLVDEPEPEPLGGQPEGAPAQVTSAPQGTVVVVRDEPGFFVLRQQVAWYKQTIILPPPPGTPAPLPAQATAALAAPTRQLQGYEQLHPELKSAPTTWSQARPPEYRPQPRMRLANPGPGQGRGQRIGQPRAGQFRPRPGTPPNGKEQPPKKGKRKRRWPEQR